MFAIKILEDDSDCCEIWVRPPRNLHLTLHASRVVSSSICTMFTEAVIVTCMKQVNMFYLEICCHRTACKFRSRQFRRRSRWTNRNYDTNQSCLQIHNQLGCSSYDYNYRNTYQQRWHRNSRVFLSTGSTQDSCRHMHILWRIKNAFKKNQERFLDLHSFV